MSQIRIIAMPTLVPGFQLAGVTAYAAETTAEAAALLSNWLEAGVEALVAIDERLLHRLDPVLRRRLDRSTAVHYLALPSGEPLPPDMTSRARIAALIREALGFTITFQGETA